MSVEQKIDKLTSLLEKNTEALGDLALDVQKLTLNREHDLKLNTMLGEKVDDLDVAVNGCTENKVTGLMTKMDRVERTEDSRAWNLRALWVGMIAVIGGIISDMMGWRG